MDRKSIRLLVADDSPVFRHMMKKALAHIPEVELVAEARDGEDALRVMRAQRVDVATVDMTMPRMNGLALLRKMRRQHPGVAALVLTCPNEEEAALTVEALEAGAFDFILKPPPSADADRKLAGLLRPRLIAAARGTSRPAAAAAPRITPRRPARQPSRTRPGSQTPDIIAIGASTGGPAALHTVLAALPAAPPAPVVVTQHMPGPFLASLAERLDRDTKLPATLAGDGMPLRPGRIYIAPGEAHLEIRRAPGGLECRLSDAPPEHHCKPAVDPMFRSLAALAPCCRTLAIVLTGMGSDGAAGALAIREAGGHVIAQDEATSVVWGMPGATVKQNAASEVLPLTSIAPAITARCGMREGGRHYASATA